MACPPRACVDGSWSNDRVAPSVHHKCEVPLRLGLNSDRVPAELTSHQLGDAVGGRRTILAMFIVLVEAADHHVFHCLRQLSPHCVHDFRFDCGVVGYEPTKEPPIGPSQVEDSSGLCAIVPQQVLNAYAGYSELSTSLAKSAQVSRLSAGEWLEIRPGLRMPRTAVAVAELSHGHINHLGGHRAICRQLPAY